MKRSNRVEALRGEGIRCRRCFGRGHTGRIAQEAAHLGRPLGRSRSNVTTCGAGHRAALASRAAVGVIRVSTSEHELGPNVLLERGVRLAEGVRGALFLFADGLEERLGVRVRLPQIGDHRRLGAQRLVLGFLPRTSSRTGRAHLFLCLGSARAEQLEGFIRGARAVDGQDGDYVLYVANIAPLLLVHVLDELAHLLVARLLGVERRLTRRARGLHVVEVELVRGQRQL